MPSGIVGYNWWLDGVKVNDVLVPEPGTFTFDGLQSNESYDIAFTVVDAAGNESAPSAVLPTTTLATPTGSDPLPVEDRDAIDAFVAAKLKPLTKTDGALVGISTPGGSYFKAYGGDRTSGVALTLDHKMRYGSISKMYTALLVLKRVDDGLLSLDDTLNQFDTDTVVLSDISNADIITIQNLLQMTSGIQDYLQQDPAVAQAYFTKPTAAFDPLPYIKSYEPLFEPGTQSSYSNSNTILLGHILECIDVAGRDARTIVLEDCVGVLGLNATEWPTGNLMTAPYSRGWSNNLALPAIQALLGPLAFLAGLFGYKTTAEVEFTAVNTAYGGTAGALDGTIADLVKFGEAIASGALISPEMKQLRDETFVTYLDYVPANPWEGPGRMYFGLGIIQWGSWQGWVGNLGGYLAVMFANPFSGSVIAVVMNHMQSTALDLFYRIAYLLDPDSTQARANVVVRPEPATAVATGFTPVVTMSGNQVIQPAPARATARGGAIGKIVQPAAATAVATGLEPVVTVAAAFTPFTETNVNKVNEPVPDGATACYVTLDGAGGGGAAGFRGNSNSKRVGGPGGGGGGKVFRVRIPVEDLGPTYSTTYGLPGVGGAAPAGTASAGGRPGTAGGLSQFTSGAITLTANGGGGAAAWTGTGTPAAGAGGTASASGVTATTANGTAGGAAGSGAGSDAGGDAPNNTAGAAAGGGGGGGITTSNAKAAGGKGGDTLTGTGGAGGTSSTHLGADGPDQEAGGAGPGGGGGWGTGYNGGAGGGWGGGGGGAGAATVGQGGQQTGGGGGPGYAEIQWVND